jgi:hypothetical protein
MYDSRVFSAPRVKVSESNASNVHETQIFSRGIQVQCHDFRSAADSMHIGVGKAILRIITRVFCVSLVC